MTLDQAKVEAKKQADNSGMMRMVYKNAYNNKGEYGVACTLPMHGNRVGNYYPDNYTIPAGWYDNKE